MIFFGVPTIDGRIHVECAIGIFKAVTRHESGGGQTYFHSGISDIALARNIIVHKFLASDCDRIMMIDSDIIFSETDFRLMLESEKDIVTAPYARKIPGKAPAMFGLGFTLVHRRVFTAMDNLVNDDGEPIVSQFYMDGEIHSNYFPVGVTGDSRWLGEDRAFFVLCSMCGIPYTMETRCRLQHVGNFTYGYPYQSNDATFWSPEPQSPEDKEFESAMDTPVQVM
jgi:hypothetical protein